MVDLAEVLREADASFEATGDVLEALGWIAFAAKAGMPLPPKIGTWLHDAIRAYQGRADRPSMDAVMGLNVRGAANPREARRRRAILEGDMARMSVLQLAGATAPEAAVIVASLGHHKATTLLDRYTRSGLGTQTRAARTVRKLHFTEVLQILSEYPDNIRQAADAKASILKKVYAKRRL